MPRTIPIALQEHRASGLTTTCYLMKVKSVHAGVPVYGVTSLDRDVVYDDGSADGELTYHAAVGLQPASLLGTSNLAIDNSETPGLLPEFDVPISEADIQAGIYDFANFWLYEVNYESLSDGHDEIRSGTLGRFVLRDGLSFTTELRGLSQKLKQTVCARDSLTCRATLGSQPFGTGGGVIEEREYCGIDMTGYWVAGEVTAVGSEANYAFADSSMSEPVNALAPGMVRWLTGANTGWEQEIESNTETSISLLFRTPYPIQVGDTYERRVDCSKVFDDDIKGCKFHWGSEAPERFRGEPHIPIGDAIANATPGGTTSPVQGGVSDQAEA